MESRVTARKHVIGTCVCVYVCKDTDVSSKKKKESEIHEIKKK